MTASFERELRKLQEMVIGLGVQVASSLQDALRALEGGDVNLAEQVIGRDVRIDRTEVDVELQCQHLLALQQPVARDLRFVISALKINNDLERMGDQAANIATQVLYLPTGQKHASAPDGLAEAGCIVQGMCADSMRAFEEMDVDLAKDVMARDDKVDVIHAEMHHRIENAMQTDASRVGEMVTYLKISRELERIADLAVNICEDVLYISAGEIARHVK